MEDEPNYLKLLVKDKNVASVIKQHADRANHGLAKYGVTTERTDLSVLQWLQHLQDELMDAAVYVERLKQVTEMAVAMERRAAADFVTIKANKVWGKNLGELILRGEHVAK